MQVLNENYWIELLDNIKSIAKSLETIAAKPPVAVTLEITEDLLTEMQAREMLK